MKKHPSIELRDVAAGGNDDFSEESLDKLAATLDAVTPEERLSRYYGAGENPHKIAETVRTILMNAVSTLEEEGAPRQRFDIGARVDAVPSNVIAAIPPPS